MNECGSTLTEMPKNTGSYACCDDQLREMTHSAGAAFRDRHLVWAGARFLNGVSAHPFASLVRHLPHLPLDR